MEQVAGHKPSPITRACQCTEDVEKEQLPNCTVQTICESKINDDHTCFHPDEAPVEVGGNFRAYT